MFACVYVPPSSDDSPSSQTIARLAREFSPRFETIDEATVVLDVDGLRGMWGDLRGVGDAMRRAAVERRIRCRIAVAATRIAALLSVHGRAEALTIIEPGREAAALAPLPLAVLERVMELGSTGGATSVVQARNAWGTIPVRTRFGRSTAAKRFREARRSTGRMLQTLRRWGLDTLGDLAALPRDALFARLGADGEHWQRCARGEEVRPLVPVPEDPPFEASLELDWPIEGLEPLSFILGRVLDPLCARLGRADAAAAVLSVRLWLVTRVWHVRTLQLPAPIRDPRVLRTLLLLDLESHPPPAGIDRVTVAVTPAPARIVQFSLLERAGPSAEQLSTLLARLTALMGERRCGAPALVDSHRPGAFDIQPFAPELGRGFAPNPRAEPSGDHLSHRSWAPTPTSRCSSTPLVAAAAGACPAPHPREPRRARLVPHAVLRRFRNPLAARVAVDAGCPVRVSAAGGVGSHAVDTCAGPWRTSGHWWGHSSVGRWSHDEWDVALRGGGVYRIYRDRAHGGWFVAGVMD